MKFTEKEIREELFIEEVNHIVKLQRMLNGMEGTILDYFEQYGIPVKAHDLLRSYNSLIYNMGLSRADLLEFLEFKKFKFIYGKNSVKHILHPDDLKKVDIDDLCITLSALGK